AIDPPGPPARAVSSVVGRLVYTEDVGSSTLSPPTISPLPTRRDYCRLPGCATLNPSREAPMLDRVSAVIRLHKNDNEVVARAELLPGASIDGDNVTARDISPAGHKVATAPIAPGEPVRKYNQIIGFASKLVEPGQHVHTHNLAMGDFDRDYAFGADTRPTQFFPDAERTTFQGFI